MWASTATSTLTRPPNINEQQWQDFLQHRLQRDIIAQQAHALNNVNQANGPQQLGSLTAQSWQSHNRPVRSSPPRGTGSITQQNRLAQPEHVYQQPLPQSQTVHLNSAQHQSSTAVRQGSIGRGPNQRFTATTVPISHMPLNSSQLHNSTNAVLPPQVSDASQHDRNQNASGLISIPPPSQHTFQKAPSHTTSPARTRSLTASSSTDNSTSFTVHDDNAAPVRLGRPSTQSAYEARISNHAQQTPPRLTRAQSSGLSTAMSQESPTSMRSGASPRRGRSTAGSPVNGQDQISGRATKCGPRGGKSYLPR